VSSESITASLNATNLLTSATRRRQALLLPRPQQSLRPSHQKRHHRYLLYHLLAQFQVKPRQQLRHEICSREQLQFFDTSSGGSTSSAKATSPSVAVPCSDWHLATVPCRPEQQILLHECNSGIGALRRRYSIAKPGRCLSTRQTCRQVQQQFFENGSCNFSKSSTLCFARNIRHVEKRRVDDKHYYCHDRNSHIMRLIKNDIIAIYCIIC
jgi:hypothetical protein